MSEFQEWSEMQAKALGALVEALAKAKATIKAPKKGRTANAGKYSYNYADRADVIDAYQQALAENGLAIVHTVTIDEGMHTVLLSRLLHSSGACLESSYPIPNVEDAQTLGSWLTYLERYASCALLDIAAEDDDDGQRAKKPARQSDTSEATSPSDLPWFDLRVAIRDGAQELEGRDKSGVGVWSEQVRAASAFDKDGKHFEFTDPFSRKYSEGWLKTTLANITAKLQQTEPGAAEAAGLFT